jgi:carbonic anhydrase/acetyltransferase-like protein (isoleucine patch superfamily)
MADLIPFGDRSPVVPASAFVARNATLIGDVRLGEHASVFSGAVLRGDMDAITVGDNTNLQDGVIVHVDDGRPAIIGADVSVGHGAVIHGCTIERGCLIGIRATVLNGAVIGEGSLVAAGAVVLEGTVIPPRSLVAGVPAKVRGELTDEQAARVARNSEIYVELAAQHAGLR